MTLDALGLALGTAFAAGLNVYATVATLGLLQRLGVVTLPAPLAVVGHPVVLGVAIALYVVEFLADKIPYIDNVWDVVHTFIRPPAAAVLAYAAVAGVPEAWRVTAALVAGGVALTSHTTKAATRAAVNTSPEPVSNSAVSVFEDFVAIGIVWLAASHPLLALGVVLVLLAVAIWALWKIFGLLRRFYGAPRRAGSTPGD
jgi:uncharacterized protein DUF4126